MSRYAATRQPIRPSSQHAYRLAQDKQYRQRRRSAGYRRTVGRGVVMPVFALVWFPRIKSRKRHKVLVRMLPNV